MEDNIKMEEDKYIIYVSIQILRYLFLCIIQYLNYPLPQKWLDC